MCVLGWHEVEAIDSRVYQCNVEIVRKCRDMRLSKGTNKAEGWFGSDAGAGSAQDMLAAEKGGGKQGLLPHRSA